MQNAKLPVPWNKVKLFLLAPIVILGLPYALYLINGHILSGYGYGLPLYYIFIIAWLPLIIVLALGIRHGGIKGLGETLTLIKYYKYCPIFFYYDPKPLRYEVKDIEKLKELIEPGDILLRRHHRYLDGLILQQTSYFTHAALYYGEHEGRNHQIMHAMGENGVCFIDLENFAKCDDLLLLRFNFELSVEASKFKREVLPKAPL
jgi:hypothetical protein